MSFDTRPMADPQDTAPAGPEATLADGFARQMSAWALASGATSSDAQALAAAACAVSLATSAGHVALDLAEWVAAAAAGPEVGVSDDTAAGHGVALARWRQRLLASGLVGTPGQPGNHPLILDDGQRLYLHRYFDFERRLARRLARCTPLATAPDCAADAALAARLSALFPVPAGQDPAAPDWQKLAAALALHGRLTVISGGPGTGKTTTVVNLLACLLAQQPQARIVLAAPTGKAAARLSQALQERAVHLDDDLRRRLPTESFTVHRLLGVRADGQGDGPDGAFVHHAGHPLALDVLVVDEASMLDLALATRLLEAVPDSARIVLLGDKDQLAAVESGAVFAELSADPTLSDACRARLGALCGLPPERIVPAAPAKVSPLVDRVIWFDRNHRFAADSGIGRLAADTVAGRADAAIAWLRDGADATVRWIDDGAAAPLPGTLQAISDGFQPYLQALRLGLHDAGAPARITDAFGAFRVLCAVHEGPRGIDAVNAQASRLLMQALHGGTPRPAGSAEWFAGRPVMVLRNDPVQKLFNGDIGITLPDADGALQVVFPDAAGGFRAVAPGRLPPHQTAFAMTVHKAQGSEFDAVLVLLPAHRSRVLGRELLYTAVTRARRQVVLVGAAPVLAAAIASGTRRHSGLLARLAEAQAMPQGGPAR